MQTVYDKSCLQTFGSYLPLSLSSENVTNPYLKFPAWWCQGHVGSNVEVLHFSADNKVSGSCYRAPKHDGALLGKPSGLRWCMCSGNTHSCFTQYIWTPVLDLEPQHEILAKTCFIKVLKSFCSFVRQLNVIILWVEIKHLFKSFSISFFCHNRGFFLSNVWE